MKKTTEEIEEQEISKIVEALTDGSIELNDEFLRESATGGVGDLLKQVKEEGRAEVLSEAINTEKVFFISTVAPINQNGIFLNISEVEVPFEGPPEEYFEEPEDFVYDGDGTGSGVATLNVGYGLFVPVDIMLLYQAVYEKTL